MLDFIQTRTPMQWVALASWAFLMLAGYATGFLKLWEVGVYLLLLVAAIWIGHETSRRRS